MKGNGNTAFKELKKSANSSQAAQPQIEISVDGALTTDSAAILTRFAEHFFPPKGVSDDSRWIFFNMNIGYLKSQIMFCIQYLFVTEKEVTWRVFYFWGEREFVCYTQKE